MNQQKVIIALLVLVALLLTANLAVQLGAGPSEAQANIVEGKNIFSTSSPDGETVYLWGYTQSGSLDDTTVNAFYYGKITPSGYQKP